MPWGEIGAFLLVLAVIFAVGRLWFCLVEGLLGRIRSCFARRREPPAWHPLPEDEEEKKL